MQKQRQRMMKRLARRAEQEHEASAQRTQRSRAIMDAFERRRVSFVTLFLALLLVPVVFTLAPGWMWGSWAFLALAILLVWIGPFVLRYVVWRCPNCNRVLPVSTRFGPFERRKEDCPYCGARLEDN